jgi:hypothetical protein
MPDPKNYEALKAEFNAKDEQYQIEFKRINKGLDTLGAEIQTSFRVLSEKIDNNANNNRITLPVVLSVIGTILSCAVVAGVIHTMSLAPLYTQDTSINQRISRIEDQLQNEINSGHNPHALNMRIDMIEQHIIRSSP